MPSKRPSGSLVVGLPDVNINSITKINLVTLNQSEFVFDLEWSQVMLKLKK